MSRPVPMRPRDKPGEFAHQGRGYQPEMKRVGLVADPAKPTVIAREMGDLDQEVGWNGQAWDVEIVSEPFTAA